MDRNLRIRMLLEAGDRATRPLRDIASGSTKAAQAMKATRDRLRDLNRAQGDINGFRELKAGIRSTEAEMSQAQARVAALARQMEAAGTPSKRLANDFAKAKRESAALKTEHGEQSRRLQQLRDRLGAAGIATSDLSRHERRLRGDIGRTNDELAEQGRRLRATADHAQRFSAARDRFQKGMGVATGMAAGGFSAMETGRTILRPLTAAGGNAMDHESGMTDIAQKADLSRDAARKMGDTVLQIASAANQLPEAIRAGIDTLSGFGLDPRQALQMMQPIGRAATAYKADIADLSAAAFAANDNLKVPVAETAKVIDIMSAAGKAGAFEIKDMASHFPALTAASQALGQHGTAAVADLAAALQIARKGAGSSDQAATNVANLLQKINSPATVRAFKKNFGVDLPGALKKLYAEGKTPIEAIAELASKTVGGDLSKLGYIFEDAQVQGALRPLIQNLEEYRRIRAEAGAAGGTTDADFAERMKDAAEQSRQYNVEMESLSITVGTLVLPAAIKLAQKVGGAAKSFSAWARANPGFAKGLALTAGILGALFVVLGGGAIAVAGLVVPFMALGAAATFLNIGMLPLVGIVLAVLAAIGLLAGGAYLIYNSWSGVSDFFGNIWQNITGFFKDNWEQIRNILLGALVVFFPVVAALALVAKKVYDNWDTIKGAFNAGIAFLWGCVQPIVQPFLDALNFISGLVGRFVQLGWDIIKGIGKGILDGTKWLLGIVGGLAGRIGAAFAKRMEINSPSRVFMGFGNFMMQGLAAGIDGGRNVPINRLSSLSRDIGTAMALGASAPAIAGGSAGQGVVGGGGQSAVTYNITVQAPPGADEQKLVDLLERKLAELKRREGAGRGGSFADTPDWSGYA